MLSPMWSRTGIWFIFASVSFTNRQRNNRSKTPKAMLDVIRPVTTCSEKLGARMASKSISGGDTIRFLCRALSGKSIPEAMQRSIAFRFQVFNSWAYGHFGAGKSSLAISQYSTAIAHLVAVHATPATCVPPLSSPLKNREEPRDPGLRLAVGVTSTSEKMKSSFKTD